MLEPAIVPMISVALFFGSAHCKMVGFVICDKSNVFLYENGIHRLKLAYEKNDLYFLPELSSNMVIVIRWC